MTRAAFLWLMTRPWKQRPGRAVAGVFAALLASIVLTATAMLALGLPSALIERLEEAFPARRLIIRPEAKTLLMLQLQASLSESQITMLTNLPGVGSVYPVLPLRVPVSLRGEILGQPIQSDSFIWGVPAELVKDSIAPGAGRTFAPVDWRGREPQPAIAPGFFLDLYNNGLAISAGYPQLNPASAIGHAFDILIGYSTIAEVPESQRRIIPAEIIGLSADTNLAAVLVPIDTVRSIHRAMGVPAATDGYLLAVLDTESLDDVESVTRTIEGVGLRVTAQRDVARSGRVFSLVAMGLLLGIGGVAFILTALFLGATFAAEARERSSERSLLVALGGTRRLAVVLALARAVVTTLLGAVAGATCVWLAGVWVQPIMLAALPPLSFAPDRLLETAIWLPVVVVILLVVLAVAASAWAVWSADRRGTVLT